MPALLGVLVQWVAILATMAVTDTKPFYATYLLTPRKPSTHHRTSTYVGFTVSPARRIRQHNRELEGGAAATDANKPWEMLCVLHGFSSASSALSFEWAWQHAYSSAKTRECMAELIGEPGRGTACSVRRKLSEMCAMMFLPPWKGEHLTLSFTSIEALAMAHDLRVPPHTRVDVRAVETFPAEGNCCGVPPCFLCKKGKRAGMLQCSTDGCLLSIHLACATADLVVSKDKAGTPCLRPAGGRCPLCAAELFWPLRPDKSHKRKRDPTAGTGFVVLGPEGSGSANHQPPEEAPLRTSRPCSQPSAGPARLQVLSRRRFPMLARQIHPL